MDAGGVDPADIGKAAGLEGLGEIVEGVLGFAGKIDGDEGADFFGHWDFRLSRSSLRPWNQETRASREYWALAGLGFGTTKTCDVPMVWGWRPSCTLNFSPSA